VVRITRGADGRWAVVNDPRNRRVTGATPMEIAGPVRGHALVRTKYSPDGTRVRGTLNNCAHGVTPWNTYMAAEENWAGYFRNTDQVDQKPDLPREHARYGVPTGQGRYNWDQVSGGGDEFIRFNVSRTGANATQDYRNEVNAFGWMVEIDPFNPNAVPVKRTSLGRFAHEGVVFGPAREGRPVVAYSGDDSTFEYIYKFVSARPFVRATANGSLLDEGILYAAKFNADGSGEWLPLVHGQGPLTAANGFADQGEVVIKARQASDLLQATKMDRPEWLTIDPHTGWVYCTLTNNSARGQPNQPGVDAANPRANNTMGHIIRWKEEDDFDGAAFQWNHLVLAGDPANTRPEARGNIKGDIYGCPDGIAFDARGVLWIQTDVAAAAMYKGEFANIGNNQMLACDPATGETRRFLSGPTNCEITGVAFTPDGTTMFISVQHPGETPSERSDPREPRKFSNWPDYQPGGRPRSANVVIRKLDGGVIGT
jgi:hypothetical protein